MVRFAKLVVIFAFGFGTSMVISQGLEKSGHTSV